MDAISHELLTALIFLPAAGALALLAGRTRNAVRWMALAATLGAFIASLLLPIFYDWHNPTTFGYGETGVVQLVARVNCISTFHIQYLVGIDGLSLPLVLLSTLICVLACVASWNVERLNKAYFALFLLLETGILGTFLALDLFLFTFFLEVTLLPLSILIGVWGGQSRAYAAVKFLLYMLVGSMPLLVVVVGIYANAGSSDLIALPSLLHARFGAGGTMPGLGKVFFVLLMIAFMVRAPAVPFHTWLLDVQAEGTSPVGMLLAALLLSVGGYGLLRVAYPLFPEAAKALWLLVALVGVVSILYGALCAMAQDDFKKFLAYTSVSHMGVVLFGAAVMTQPALNGAQFMLVAHGITSAMLLFLAGALSDRAHHRDLSRFGGLTGTMPLYWGFSAVAFFAGLGLPALCGFVGEFLVLLGAFAAGRRSEILVSGGYAAPGSLYALAVLAALGLLLTAASMLMAMQRIFFGPAKAPHKDPLPDLDPRELTVLTPLTVMAVLLGVLPGVLFFPITRTTAEAFLGLFMTHPVADSKNSHGGGITSRVPTTLVSEREPWTTHHPPLLTR